MGHTPERTCLACGRKTGKAVLLRLARDRAGTITIDPHQRLPGRGAYVCPTPACGELLKKKKGLHHGFHQPVPAEIYQRVIEFLREHASP
ncbi:MAG: YlxR family protein [candidate division KSB1 bacterium]|nr:YlxR family protein [candidate division KSB1 bacterium]MDZ7367314.1 YlxR family protein [candidate division KSB1 bacterium]MDZ7405847.1 YlxR family protein [candidate division KSB1 bacterium]